VPDRSYKNVAVLKPQASTSQAFPDRVPPHTTEGSVNAMFTVYCRYSLCSLLVLQSLQHSVNVIPVPIVEMSQSQSQSRSQSQESKPETIHDTCDSGRKKEENNLLCAFLSSSFHPQYFLFRLSLRRSLRLSLPPSQRFYCPCQKRLHGRLNSRRWTA